MVKRYVKEALNLGCMQVDCYNAGNACTFQKVCHQLCGNRFAAACFAVLTGITVIRNNCGNVGSGSAFKRISHN